MSLDFQKLRLFGVYQQQNPEHIMLRVKIPGGLLTSEQARTLAGISSDYAQGRLHLTSRGSVEFHRLKAELIDELFARLGAVGLTTRGACGGAVRGICCNTTFASGYGQAQQLTSRLNRHFAGNADFEGLPKKFKIAIEASTQGGRHLIQDLGIVLHQGPGSEEPRYDIWCAGGLGREPQAGFLLEEQVSENRLLPLIESVVQVYRDNTPPPQRLKHLVKRIGEDAFRQLLATELAKRPQVKLPALDQAHVQGQPKFIEVPVFGGQLAAATLLELAALADQFCNGQLATTTDQNLALPVADAEQESSLFTALMAANVNVDDSFAARMRTCPGNHECKRGLVATRDLGAAVQQVLSTSAQGCSWAISGCRNSCSQPQLADYGIVTVGQQKHEDGSRTPVYDLYQRKGAAFGERLATKLTEEELLAAISDF